MKKTLRLINKTLRSIKEQDEQSALPDANPPQQQEQPQPDATKPQPSQPMTSEGEKYYIDLVVRAFAHSPDDNELKIVDELQRVHKQSDPKKIADTIQRMLDGGEEEFKALL